jgi:hypothetical protein
MSELLTNRFIAHSQSLKAKVLSKSRSAMSRAAQDAGACVSDEAFRTTWTAIKRRVVLCANIELQRWRNGSTLILENEAAARPMLRQYWGAFGISPTDAQLADIARRGWQDSNPWSAVFISHIMREAGAGTFFNYSRRHMAYVWAAKQNAARRNMDNPFWLCNVTTAVPEPGDLVCRNWHDPDEPRVTFEGISSSTGHSHCDVVVSVDLPNRTMTVVGGNLPDPSNLDWGNSARAETVALNADGTVNTALNPLVYAILKLRTDRCMTC